MSLIINTWPTGSLLLKPQKQKTLISAGAILGQDGGLATFIKNYRYNFTY